MIPDFPLVSLLAALGLTLVHLEARRLGFIDVIPRSRFLSFAGGMSVAYVFLRILPDLGLRQARTGYGIEQVLRIPRDPLYLVALLGLITFYGLQRLVDRSRDEQRQRTGEDCPSPAVFWVSVVSYSIVNFTVGYLLPQRELAGPRRLLFFFVAIALWFVVTDYGLRLQFQQTYRRLGRWVLSGMILLGWAAAVVFGVPDVLMTLLVAFVAGGIVLNVMMEELPRERESRFWAFALGAIAYSLVLLLAF